ncbi:MAG: Mu-like prophage major head subunit gpT family protein [Pseudomonadota bacterium]
MPAKPKKGEGKQGFLKRCMSAAKQGGMNESRGMSACMGNWNANLADADNDIARLTGVVTLNLNGANDDPNNATDPTDNTKPKRFAILAYTGKVVNFGYWRFIIDLKGIEAKASFPALREHERDRVVGMCDSYKNDASGMHIFGNFSNATQDAAEVLALAEEGFPWQASVGVKANEIEMLEAGQKRKVNGQTVEGPLEIWTKSLVQEISFVSLGADDETAAVVMSDGAQKKDDTMDPRLLKMLEKLGLSENASLEEAQAFLTGLATDGVDLAAAFADAQNQAPAPNPAPEPNPNPQQSMGAPSQTNNGAPNQVDLAADRKRAADIIGMYARLGLPSADAQALAFSGASLDEARTKALDALELSRPSVGGLAGMTEGDSESDKFRMLAAEGMYLRSGGRVDKAASGSGEFRAMTLIDFARLALERGGHSTRGLSASQVADKIFSGGSVRLSASTSDFRAIFMDVANKRLLDAYNEVPQTWRPLVNIVTATDFKRIYGISLSEAPDFLEVKEGSEYQNGELKDNQESYKVAKFGRIMSMTREMMVNDDLRAFARMPQLYGAAAARKANDLVWSQVTDNPKLSDGKPVFDLSRGNLATTGGAVSSATLDDGRVAMRTRKSRSGNLLDIVPAFLVVPVAQETNAEILIRSMANPESGMNSATHNPWQGRFTTIAEPRLDLKSTKAWYLIASPSQVDTVEVAFMDGNEAPEIMEHEAFRTDEIQYKGRLEMGASVMDSMGMYKNAGE